MPKPTIRVIAGSAGSVPLYPVKSTGTRPMTDRVKKSLFDILTPRLAGARVLDLFAGTGALGIEALSRGAESCVFVEKSRSAAETIERNLERTKFTDQGRVLGFDAWKAVAMLSDERFEADLVIFDPPFAMGKQRNRGRLATLAERVAERLLADDGLFVYHHEFDTPTDLGTESLALTDRREYTRNVVGLFVKA